MSTSEPGAFRLRQCIADLNRQRLAFPLATVRRIGAGIGVRNAGAPDLQRRLEWYFAGKAPLFELGRDRVAQGALLMASALPEDDFEPFLAATVLLLLERLSADGGSDDGFWNWRRLAPHYRLAAPPLRAAIMCGFREARRLGRITAGAPGVQDCLTAPREDVLAMLSRHNADRPLVRLVEEAILSEIGAREAGEVWLAQHDWLPRLPDGPRGAAGAGFRYLYERRISIDAPATADLPVIPAQD